MYDGFHVTYLDAIELHLDLVSAIMRALHKTHSLPTFPIYSSSFLSEDELVLGGGGGASRSGIKNKLVSVLASFAKWSFITPQ